MEVLDINTFLSFKTNEGVQELDSKIADLETSTGTRFITKTIFIAAGVGSFQPRTIKVDGIEKFADRFGIFLVAGEEFGFGVHHEQFAAVVVEFDLAEQGDAGAGSDSFAAQSVG